MFNVNIMQQRLRRPMTIEMIPNYRHYNFHEKQFIDFMMWVAHVFDGPGSYTVRCTATDRSGNTATGEGITVSGEISATGAGAEVTINSGSPLTVDADITAPGYDPISGSSLLTYAPDKGFALENKFSATPEARFSCSSF